MSTRYEGPCGTAVHLEIRPHLDPHGTTLTWWLLHGPWHPLWSQFVLSVVTLEDRPGAEAAKLHYPGATHELLVVALNPGEPPAVHDQATLEDRGLSIGFLQPVDVCHQFTATDDEMRQIAELAARACVDGHLMPSTDDAREHYRMQWLGAITKTLAHIRGEEHAP